VIKFNQVHILTFTLVMKLKICLTYFASLLCLVTLITQSKEILKMSKRLTSLKPSSAKKPSFLATLVEVCN